MKKVLSVILALIMVLSLCACTFETPNNPDTPNSGNKGEVVASDFNITGAWQGEFAAAETMGEIIEESLGISGYQPVTTAMAVTYTFNADGSFTLLFDTDAFINAMVTEITSDNCIEAFLDATAKQGDMTRAELDELIALLETDAKTFVTDILNETFSAEEFKAPLAARLTVSGTYTFNEGSLTLNAENGDQGVYTVTGTENEITVSSAEETYTLKKAN